MLSSSKENSFQDMPWGFPVILIITNAEVDCLYLGGKRKDKFSGMVGIENPNSIVLKLDQGIGLFQGDMLNASNAVDAVNTIGDDHISFQKPYVSLSSVVDWSKENSSVFQQGTGIQGKDGIPYNGLKMRLHL